MSCLASSPHSPTIRLLGATRIGVPSPEVPRPGGPRQRALLALLLVHGGDCSVEWLAEALWSDSRPPATARRTVHVYVCGLRKELAACGGRIESRGPAYRLRVDRAEVDLLSYTDAVGRAAHLVSRHPAAALAAYERSSTLWRGRPFADLPPLDELVHAAAGYEEARVGAEERRLGLMLDVGDRDRAIAELEHFVRRHPLREGAVARLMTALYRQGRQVDALLTYARTCGLLREEFGLMPGPELRSIEQLILAQGPEPASSPRSHRTACSGA